MLPRLERNVNVGASLEEREYRSLESLLDWGKSTDLASGLILTAGTSELRGSFLRLLATKHSRPSYNHFFLGEAGHASGVVLFTQDWRLNSVWPVIATMEK
ncbi:hypothetical protein CEE69_19375 [Rhodopirellula bahusiensis]|uniref:Uncharacterized protein n=1 Tax=Rhodopirellula bahusiensis TaxID=2014065 RepID=A0A2G1W3W5_9BACT|nr:hypothetical protein CEE69_19375 [Rhodopirellula bahusiensis]